MLGLLFPFYLLLYAVLFERSYEIGLESERLEPPYAYVLVVFLLTIVSLVLATATTLVSERLPERTLLPLLLSLNALALAIGVIALGPPWSAPLLIPSIAGLVLLVAAGTGRGLRLSSAVLASAVIAGVAWFGQAPCAEARCLEGAMEAAQHRFPVLVVENYGGLYVNILKFRGHYYAIHQLDGSFDLQRYSAGLYAGGVDDRSLEEVMRKLAPPAQPEPEPTATTEGNPEAGGSDLPVAPLTALVVALVLLAVARIIGRPRLSTVALASLAVAAMVWTGQALCAEAACPLSSIGDEQHRNPVLVREDHNNFNVVKFRDHFYAIPQGQGAFILERYNAGEYLGGVDGASLAEVLRKLDEPAGPQPQSPAAPVEVSGASGSELVVAGYLSPRFGSAYNVYHYEDRFYAIRAAEGSLDLYHYQAGGYTDAFDGASLDEVIQQLDAPPGGAVVLAAPLEPLERYRGYVIFEFGHLFYALVEGPEGMDDEEPFSVERFWRGEYPGALDGNSLEQLHERIDARFAPATLIYGGYRGYDIWEWGGRVFGIHTADGAFEIGRYERGEYAGAVEGASIPEAVEAIEAATEGAQAGGAGN